MKSKTTGVKLAKLFLTFVLFLCFMLHIWGQLRKYFAKRTMTIEEKTPVAQALMPSFTICSEEAYKADGFFFNQSLFDQHTIPFEQLFHSDTMKELEEKDFTVSEIHSQERGRCFTISSEHIFRSGDSLKLIFHEDGHVPLMVIHGHLGEFWLRANYWPDEVEIDSFDEPLNCLLEPKNELYMPTAGDSQVSCKKWDNEEFFDCAEQRWKAEIIAERFTCYTVWWKSLFPAEIEECQGETDLDEIIRLSKWLENPEAFPFQFASNPNQFGCPLPCFRSVYGLLCRPHLEKNTYHNLIEGHEDRHEGKFEISLSVKMLAEIEEQVLIFDFSAIVAGVGGSLGLFLGFSCLEMLSPMLHRIARVMKKHE